MASSIDNMFVILASIAIVSQWHDMTVMSFTPPSSIRQHHKPSALLTPMSASIYYPDGSVTNSYEDSSSPMSNDIYELGVSSFSDSMNAFSHLANDLSANPALTPTLAKLASAYSPPGFAIDLAHVNNVRCLSVDQRHLEIEAVVCDDMECSSLLVPVDFPEVCPVDELEACVLRNVESLNERGEFMLGEQKVFAEEEEAQRAFDVLQSVGPEYFGSFSSSSSTSALPYWWEAPKSASDDDECDLLRQLLNGNDFRDTMRGLAEYSLLHDPQQDLTGKTIRTVKVQAVGPAGMVLTVQLMGNGGSDNEAAAVNAPIKFDDMCVSNSEASIREKVLMIVSSVTA